MARRLIVNDKCPLCGDRVDIVPDHILKQKPHYKNAEFVVTKAGYKQYIHTSCWNEMIAERRPYTRKATS